MSATTTQPATVASVEPPLLTPGEVMDPLLRLALGALEATVQVTTGPLHAEMSRTTDYLWEQLRGDPESADEREDAWIAWSERFTESEVGE